MAVPRAGGLVVHHGDLLDHRYPGMAGVRTVSGMSGMSWTRTVLAALVTLVTLVWVIAIDGAVSEAPGCCRPVVRPAPTHIDRR